MRVLIDGVETAAGDATVSVFDWGVLRGYGAFEVIRSYGGRPFRADQHIERMHRSAEALGLPAPPSQLAEWVDAVAADGDDCLVRVLMTAGSRDSLTDAPGHVIVLWEEMPALPDAFRLSARPAPWHAGGDYSELTGAKTLSYAPNMAAAEAAAADGFDDALLLGRDGSVLEGPTFTVAWFRDGTLETPSLELGILASITRRVVLEVAADLGINVVEGTYPLERLTGADEAVVMSTVKEVAPLIAVDAAAIGTGSLTAKLRDAVRDRIAAEV